MPPSKTTETGFVLLKRETSTAPSPASTVTSGDGEAAEQDSGYLDPVDEVSTYSAISYQFDGVAYRVFEFDTGILHWDDEGSFERLD